WPEQARTHLLELGIGCVGIVEDALHVRIDPRLGPGAFDHHGDAETNGIGGAALALSRHHEFRLDPERQQFGAEVDGAGTVHPYKRADQTEIGRLRLASLDPE